MGPKVGPMILLNHTEPLKSETSPATTGGAMPLLLWGIVSILPLLVSAARIPLWARPSPPIEQYALAMMLVTQIAITGMLFPFLFSSPVSAVGVMLGSIVMLQLAGLLSDASAAAIFRTIAWTSMWQVSWWLLHRSLRSQRVQQVGVALATTAGVGGLILIYLRSEFWRWGEVGADAMIWIGLSSLALIAVLVSLVRSRQDIHS